MMETARRKYSIIVVTFNNADGLERTLRSIRQLDYAPKETIVIDGGSKDGSLDIVERNKDIITVALSEEDTGIYNAMNKGIRLATGDYVAFMNAGDEFADKFRVNCGCVLRKYFGQHFFRGLRDGHGGHIGALRQTFRR